MGLTLSWLSIIVLIPLAGLFLRTLELSPEQFWAILSSRRTLNALRVSFGLALFSGGTVDFSRVGMWSYPHVFPWTDTPPSDVKLPRKEDQSQA